MILPRSVDDLRQSLEEQLNFLHKSCRDFDQGDESEAKRIANTLRLLLKDTRGRTKSLLGQLDQRNQFLDTSYRIAKGFVYEDDPVNILSEEGSFFFALLIMRLRPLFPLSMVVPIPLR
jgi:hypothetical protein